MVSTLGALLMLMVGCLIAASVVIQGCLPFCI
jgi:hypothetical protein